MIPILETVISLPFFSATMFWTLFAVCAAVAFTEVRAQCGNPPGPCCVVAGSILHTVNNECLPKDQCDCTDFEAILGTDGEIGRCILSPYECLELDDESTPETYMK